MKKQSIYIAGLAIFLGMYSLGYAYPSGPFNAKHLLDSADLVCHGRVSFVKPYDVVEDKVGERILRSGGSVARLQIINIIKGNAASEIDVVFRKSATTVVFTELTKNEESILFLRSKGGHYRFVDDHNGKLSIPSHKAIQYKSESPEHRMLAELIFATEVDQGRIRLICAEQLGNFSQSQSLKRLKELSREKDMATQGVAYSALINLDHPPSALDLVKFFLRQDETKSLQQFGTTGYSNSHLKGSILNNIEGRLNVIERDFDLKHTSAKYVARKNVARTAAERWKDFDLISFLKSAPWQNRDISSVRDNRVIAEIVGRQIDEKGIPAVINKTYRKGSRTIVLGLLENKHRQIRFAAARAIDRMIRTPHKFPYPQHRDSARFTKEVDAYVHACHEWLLTHKE